MDTNFILGLLKSDTAVLSEVSKRKILATECAYSAITRIELLGFPGITRAEDSLTRQKLEHFTLVSLTSPIEDMVIKLRQTRKKDLKEDYLRTLGMDYENGKCPYFPLQSYRSIS